VRDCVDNFGVPDKPFRFNIIYPQDFVDTGETSRAPSGANARAETNAPQGNENMKSADLYPSKYLRVADLGGKEKILTIDRVEVDLFENDGRKQQKPVVYFKEDNSKPLVINKTNFGLICAATGADDTDNWPGKKITAYPDMVGFRGQVHETVRVRRAPEFNDEIPTL
jgi:hypothetical protein